MAIKEHLFMKCTAQIDLSQLIYFQMLFVYSLYLLNDAKQTDEKKRNKFVCVCVWN